jgi:hypothetical protein
MFTFRNLFPVFHETPDPTAVAGGGGAGNPAPGTPPQGQGQPPAGTAPAQPQAQGVRQYFPNVPDEHWALMEPHVGQFEGYVTQLQQQVAPFKQLTDAGYDPQRLQGLVNFESRFAQDPLNVWLEMGQMLQQGQNGQNPALHPDVDLEYLAAIARGEDPDATPGVTSGQPGAQQQGQMTPELQAAYQQIQQLTQTVEQLQGSFQQDQVQRQTAIQDQFYNRRMEQMKQALTKGGWPEELLSEEALGAHVITHRGDFQKATQSLLDQRAALLKGIADPRLNPTPNPTNLPNGAPPVTQRQVPRRDENDSFRKGTRNAEARLRRLNGGG